MVGKHGLDRVTTRPDVVKLEAQHTLQVSVWNAQRCLLRRHCQNARLIVLATASAMVTCARRCPTRDWRRTDSHGNLKWNRRHRAALSHWGKIGTRERKNVTESDRRRERKRQRERKKRATARSDLDDRPKCPAAMRANFITKESRKSY